MKKTVRKLSVACGLGVLSLAAVAQTEVPMDMYVPMFDKGTTWVDMLENWTPGQNPEEEFFISHVRPLERFYNQQTQVYPEVDPKGKKVMWWMPITNGGWSLNLPSYTMRNDNFSMWSYLDVHGGWNQPIFRSSGTFTDVCHKNGVKNTVVIFFDSSQMIDYTKPSSNEPSRYFSVMFKEQNGKFVNVERFVKMFRYYGISGLSINPESSMTEATANKLQDFILACNEKAQELGWGNQWNICWYDSMNNRGGVSYSGNTLWNQNYNWFAYRDDRTKQVADHFFLNYNHGQGQIQNAVREGKKNGHSSYDVYVGQYIGGRGLGDSWKHIMDNEISIGTWGEHTQNNIFYNSTDKGSDPLTVAQVYTEKQEMFFSGGNRNPLNAPAYITERGDLSYESMRNFNGVATKVAAQSTLSQLPFITYFSLGSGMRNFQEGKSFSDFQWYNIGMQDFMPTWRWWVADKSGKAPADAIACSISYDEAYNGSNSLKLSGRTSYSNVRLFKTKFGVSGSEKFTLIYKMNKGTEPKLKLTYSLEGAEGQLKSIVVPAVKTGEWSKATWTLNDWGIKHGDVIACLGVEVENTSDDYAVYIGGMELINPEQKFNPVKPTLVTSGYGINMNYSAYNFETIKLIWNAKKAADAWSPVYNDEVDTWFYEVMYSEDGSEAKLANRTTSWAAVTAIPLSSTCKKFKVGVRAVAPDGATRSEIAWLDQEFEHKFAFKTGIVFNATKLVPNEEFTVALEDPTIPTAHWTLKAEDGSVVAEMDGRELVASCANIGLYNVTVRFDNPTQDNPGAVYEKEYVGLVVVTPESTGRMPKADFSGELEFDVDNGPKTLTYDFTGIRGEGYTSNAVDLTDGTHFFAADPAVLGRPNALTIAAWVKPTNQAGQVMSLRNLETNPSWGSTWIYLERNKAMQNQVQFCLMGRDRGADFKDMFSGMEVMMGSWYHVAMVLDRDNTEVRLYVNGKCVGTQRVSFKTSYDLYSLGTEGFQGSIDEVQFWNKALTDEEVKVAMYGYKPNEVPEGLQGYWVFEDRLADNNKKFPNLGKAGNYPGGIFKGTSLEDKDNLEPIVVSGSTWLSGSTKVKSTLTWTFGGAKAVDLSNDEHPAATFAESGKYMATLVISNAYGTDTKSKELTIWKDGQCSVEEVTEARNACIRYENEEVMIDLIAAGAYRVLIYDATGRLIALHKANGEDGDTLHCQVGELTEGAYLVKVLCDETPVATGKIIVQ